MVVRTPSVEANAAPAWTTRATARRVCVISEDLSGAPDEGVKKTALALAQALSDTFDTSLLCTEGVPALPNARLARASRSFLSAALARALRAGKPDLILYVARSSTTGMAFLRSRVLHALCPQARIVLIGLQARRLSRWQARLLPLLRPARVFVQSPDSKQHLEQLGCDVELLPSGVDLECFAPVGAARRAALRAQYGLRDDLPVVLHVGHLQTGRGVRVLLDLAVRRRCQVALVASSSTQQEALLADELRRGGVMVLDHYLPHVAHLYQLADCYVFPVRQTDHAMEVPLSVLEACACDLPVVSTRFGGLPRLFGGAARASFRFVETEDDLVRQAELLCQTYPAGTRPLVAPYSWSAVAHALVERALA